MSLQWSKIGMEDPKRTLWQCTASVICVCSGSVLLGDLLGVSRIWTTLKQIQGTWSSVCSVDLSWIFVCAYLLYIVAFFIFVLLCYNLMDVRCFGLVVSTCAPPLPFGRIYFVVLVMRKGGDNSWSGHWHLGCTLEVLHVHSYQDQYIQPGWTECVLCVFSLGLYFVYLFVLL